MIGKQLSARLVSMLGAPPIDARIITASYKITGGGAMGSDVAVCMFCVLADAFGGLLPEAGLPASTSPLA